MDERKTIVVVLRSGKDFQLRDVELIARHINKKWKSPIRPRIICLFDKVDSPVDLGNFELRPLTNNWPGTWSRIQLYSPEMEQYRPFLYVDLDTAIIKSLEFFFDLVKDKTQFITLEDFYQRNMIATGLVWFPANSKKISQVWEARDKAAVGSFRMDYFLRTVTTADAFWQQLTNTIVDFKPSYKPLVTKVPKNTSVVCFHGKPRIFNADVKWVKRYINE